MVDVTIKKSDIHFIEAINLCHNLRLKILEIEDIKRQPADFITNYFNRIRDAVDQHKSQVQALAENSKAKLFDKISLCYTECETGLELEKMPPIEIDLVELGKYVKNKYRFLNEMLVKDFYEIEHVIHELKKRDLKVSECLDGLKEVLFLGRNVSFEPCEHDTNIVGQLKLVINFLYF